LFLTCINTRRLIDLVELVNMSRPDLYRRGNTTSAKFDNVRPRDIPVHNGRVRPYEGGISTSSRLDPGCAPDKTWMLESTTGLSPLQARNDRGNHWSIEPKREMSLDSYTEHLTGLNKAAVRYDRRDSQVITSAYDAQSSRGGGTSPQRRPSGSQSPPSAYVDTWGSNTQPSRERRPSGSQSPSNAYANTWGSNAQSSRGGGTSPQRRPSGSQSPPSAYVDTWGSNTQSSRDRRPNGSQSPQAITSVQADTRVSNTRSSHGGRTHKRRHPSAS